MRNSVGVFILYVMKFEKSPLTLEQQADLLISRGLVANKQILIDLLSVINYYRLSTYLYPFRTVEEIFKENTTLELVLLRYTHIPDIFQIKRDKKT
jgi:abortive infection bacteriophage resistance protein